MFEAEIFTILLFATSEYLRIDFVTARLKMYDYSPSRNFYKTHVRQIYKIMSCKNAERGVSSGALLLAYGNFNAKRNKIRYKYS